jgi:hypothetical protein
MERFWTVCFRMIESLLILRLTLRWWKGYIQDEWLARKHARLTGRRSV